jgi:Protein of unknown function (DUF2510)
VSNSDLASEFQFLVDRFNDESNRLSLGAPVGGDHPSVAAIIDLQSRLLIDLKDLRARVLLAERSTQNAAQVEMAKAGSKDHMLLKVLAGKGAASSARATNKRAIASQKSEIVNVQRAFKTAIDDIVRQVTTSRAELKLEIAAARKSSKSRIASPAPSTAPPGWHIDPSERFEHRFWDGSRWTEHVSTNGIASTDHA